MPLCPLGSWYSNSKQDCPLTSSGIRCTSFGCIGIGGIGSGGVGGTHPLLRLRGGGIVGGTAGCGVGLWLGSGQLPPVLWRLRGLLLCCTALLRLL